MLKQNRRQGQSSTTAANSQHHNSGIWADKQAIEVVMCTAVEVCPTVGLCPTPGKLLTWWADKYPLRINIRLDRCGVCLFDGGEGICKWRRWILATRLQKDDGRVRFVHTGVCYVPSVKDGTMWGNDRALKNDVYKLHVRSMVGTWSRAAQVFSSLSLLS